MLDSRADEQQLITEAQSGNLEAFNRLVLMHQDKLYSISYRILRDSDSASDVVQDTLITAYRKIRSYRGGHFGAWLSRIATNGCYDELRRRQRQPAVSMDDMPGADHDDGPPIHSPTPTPEALVQQAELSQAIQNCISALSDDHRVTLVLCDAEGYSYSEIADNMGVALGTIKSRLSRARRLVRDCLQTVKELLPQEYRLHSDDKQ